MTEQILIWIFAFTYMGLLIRLIQLETRVRKLEHERRFER